MKIVQHVEEMINPDILSAGSRIYVSGNAATPQALLNRVAYDSAIRHIELFSVLLLGDIEDLFSEETCSRVTHRIIFNGPHSRKAVNNGWAKYQLMHLSDIPRQFRDYIPLDAVMVSVSGPDSGGNFSLGCTVEGMMGAIESVKKNGGVVLAERNAKMPFVLGTFLHKDDIDYLYDCEYDLPLSPVPEPDHRARRIARIIAEKYITDGATLQYGIGEVPEAVTDAILEKKVKDLGIHTELFADAMRKLVEKRIVTNRFTFTRSNFSIASIFLSGSKAGYDWLGVNSAVQSRPSDYTNNIINIARQPKMIAINSAIGVDLHANIWADSMEARSIYSGVGGQADFIRGAYLSEGGAPIIALKSTTRSGVSKIVHSCPAGITTTGIPADPVIIVTEHGAFDPKGLSMSEHAVGIAYLAQPDIRDDLLKFIFDTSAFHKPREALKSGWPKGFTPYEKI